MFRAALKKCVAPVVICIIWCGAVVAQPLEPSAALKIGFIPDQAPFSFKAETQVPQGYAIDLCNRIAAEISGRQSPEYIATTMADAFNALSERRVDLLCGAITINLARRTLVDFSQPIFLTGASALLRTDSPRDLRELFLGERTISPPRSPQLRPFSISVVGARSGTTTEETLRRAIRDGEYETTVVDYDSHAEGLAALESRKIDAYFADRALLFSLSQQADDASDLVIGDRLLTHEAYGIAVRRDDPDFRLRVDRALSKFYRTDEFAKLLQTYFGNEAATIKADILARAIPD